MPRILWLDINCSYVHSSLALPYIHAQRRSEDNEWHKLSATISANTGDTMAKAVALRPDIVAATAWLFTQEYLTGVIKRIKTVLPECTVILGGPEFLGNNESYLTVNSEVNCVFRGEGDTVFHDWLEVYDKPEKWSGITGLCWKTGDKYHDNGTAKADDFAALNPPETSEFFEWSKPFVQLETSRGCFNSCTFCVSGHDKPVRSISLNKIYERVENIHSKGIKEIRFLDRTFNGNSKRALEILSILENYPDMRFHMEIHPGLLTEEIKQKLRNFRHGMLHLETGIQSLNDTVLNACQRTGDTEKALDGLKFLCGLKNVIAHVDLIAGLPFYTLADLEKDIITLAQYGAEEIQLELLKLLPGTKMRDASSESGIVFSPIPPYEVLCTDSITVNELQTARLLSKLIDKYYNTRAWHSFFKNMIILHDNFIREFLQFLSRGEHLEQPLSIETRGLILFEFIRNRHPEHSDEFISVWTGYGLSARKIKNNL